MKTRIKEMRIERGITQKELAEKSNRSERQIIRIENEKSNPNGATLKSIAKALNTTVSYLIYESDAKTLKR